MRIQQIDPSAFTPPYDHALCRALAARGADVELITSEFLYGPVPEADGYEVSRDFYRRSAKRGLDARGRRLFKFAEHVPDMVRLRRELDADVIHYQWLTVPSIDTALLPPNRPRVMTAHYVLPPEPTSRQIRTAHRMFSKMDAVISQNVGHIVRSALRVLRAKSDGRDIVSSQERIRIEIVVRENLI